MNGAPKQKLDVRGIAMYLLLTFGITYSVIFLLWLNGFSLGGKHPLYANMALAFIMFLPAISAYIVREYVTGEKQSDAGFSAGPFKYYIQVYFLIPALFVIVYGLTAVFIQAPDFASYYTLHTAEGNFEVPIVQLVTGVILTTFLTAPLVNSLHAFGQEFGWRGFLLPKLLPLGKRKALVISGAIWGLWYGPFVFVGLHYSDNLLQGAVMFTVFTMVLGIYIGYLRLVSGSVFLASFAHGVFNAQFYGPWKPFFPGLDLYLGGITGILGIAVFLVLAVWILFRSLPRIL
ncbi:MAG: type II CAAX prenyl endopeptidase Rce1 family protein [Nitrospinota bacterium]